MSKRLVEVEAGTPLTYDPVRVYDEWLDHLRTEQQRIESIQQARPNGPGSETFDLSSFTL